MLTVKIVASAASSICFTRTVSPIGELACAFTTTLRPASDAAGAAEATAATGGCVTSAGAVCWALVASVCAGAAVFGLSEQAASMVQAAATVAPTAKV